MADSDSPIRIIDRETILSLIDFPGLIKTAEEAFIAQTKGESGPPLYINMPVGDNFAHFKAGYKTGSKYFILKYSGGFWSNSELGLPVDYGYVIVHKTQTGEPLIIFGDQGTITEYRTAAAGAVAAKYASKLNSTVVGVIGTGAQAHLQIEALLHVRPDINEVRVWGRHKDKITTYIQDMKVKLPGLKYTNCDKPEDAVRNVDILITAIPSRLPIVKADWISPGTHVTALGAVAPYMQEHEAIVFRKADLIYADSIEKCAIDGEIHHALEEKVLTKDQITGELGQLILGIIPGRANDEQITFVDLVGLGIQDATAAEYLYRKYFKNQ